MVRAQGGELPRDGSLARRTVLGYALAASGLGGAAALTTDVRGARGAVLLGETGADVDTTAEALEVARASAWGGHDNGRIPPSELTPVIATVAGSGYLRSDAAQQYLSMSLAFSRAVGRPLVISEGYRAYDRQVQYWDAYRAGKGNLAAYPGTSLHGWGISCDFGAGVESAGTAAKRWMDANAPSYGWSPTGNGFSQREPWHFDFTPAYTGRPAGDVLTPLQAEVVILRTTQPLTETGATYTALLGVRSLRHLQTIDRINALRVAGVPYHEVTRAQFYDIANALSLPRASFVVGADYWRP